MDKAKLKGVPMLQAKQAPQLVQLKSSSHRQRSHKTLEIPSLKQRNLHELVSHTDNIQKELTQINNRITGMS